MKYVPFSEKQRIVLGWWCRQSPYQNRDAIICDGAVRSGKTFCMALSFVAWAMQTFEDKSFALCGKTVSSLRRNVVEPLTGELKELGFRCTQKLSRNLLEISCGGRANRFYLFGGRDESSASLIQGVTLAGVLFDEVALMPRTFVEQALARCSVEGSRFWFNCNPDFPHHWFYREWILKARQKNALYLHFTMKDNPALSESIVRRYESLYSGHFYERFIEGKWVAAEGLVYSMFSEREHVCEPPGGCSRYYVSCDYGTVNPASFGLWGEREGVWYRLAEYYYSSKREGEQKTDEEYYEALSALIGGRAVEAVIVDPSAASFIACIRRHGEYRCIPAKNNVIDGIRRVCDALRAGEIRIGLSCRDAIREFHLYRWQDGGAKDAPRKENDHAMDDIRYFVETVLAGGEDGFFALSTERR